MVEMYKSLKQENVDPSKISKAKSFIRAFERAAGVVVLSTTLMFNCATTKSSDVNTSSTYIAESTTSQELKGYREIAKNAKELLELTKRLGELTIEAQRLEKEKEQARLKEEQARLKEEQALKKARELCVKMKEFLDNKEKECATNGCDSATKIKLKNDWNRYHSRCSK